ncbi:MAG: hypothetical protein M3O80_04135 [Chloroflexota bacterium]|nr:hypothetical protein [Chloroflexota bacterium]
MRRGLIALLGALIVAAGVALATPVPVLTVSNGATEFVGALDDREAMRYSYRQSIYDVPVWEEFARDGDRIDLLRVRSADIRSIEYFRWENPIVQEDDGWWASAAPPRDISELVIRIAPLGQQRITTARWTCDMLARFGETVVRVRADHRPFVLTLLGWT